jgi:predicted flap endonuclease-1-like 5' DNA nuclease
MTSLNEGFTVMVAFVCCFWWFLAGLVIGWLLNWLLSKWTRKDDSGSTPNRHVGSNDAGSSHANAAYSASNTMPKTVVGADKALALAAGFRIKGNDDLEIIEGIGPKISALFKENGAGTFDKVMHMSVPSMLAILEKGGPRFKLANPGSWAQQAKLCYENRWAELQTLQDSLTAGVDKSDSSEA